MNIYIIIVILIIHWMADFALQTEKQAKGKSKNWDDLLSHTYTYSLVWYCLLPFYVIFFTDNYIQWTGTYFILITFICHTITDYFTSRITSKKYQNNHFYGFNSFWFWIGFDQILHLTQLFLTYKLLTNGSI